MNLTLQAQVCTLEQGTKLDQLGLTHESTFVWCEEFYTAKEPVVLPRQNLAENYLVKNSAYSVMELGSMFIAIMYGVTDESPFSDNFHEKYPDMNDRKLQLMLTYNPLFLADAIIDYVGQQKESIEILNQL